MKDVFLHCFLLITGIFVGIVLGFLILLKNVADMFTMLYRYVFVTY